MSGGGGQQTQTTTSDPWAAQQPFLKDVFGQAEQLSKKPTTMAEGPLSADKTASDQAGMDYITNYAGTLAGQSDKNLNALNWATGAGNLDVGNNQYVQGQMAANTNRLYQDFNEQTVPALRSEFGKSGQIGSSRQGIAEGLASQGVARASADSNAQILGTAYGNALDTYSSALAQAPNIMQAGTMPGTLQGQVGAQERAFTQADIDEGVARNDFAQNEAWSRLANYMGLVSGNWGGTGTTTAPTGGGSTGSRVLGGAATGASIGTAFGPYGTGIGAGLGALAGLL